MEPTFIVGMITAVGVAASGVIGALAILRRANAPEVEARNVVRAIWTWWEYSEKLREVPASIRARARRIVDAPGEVKDADNTDDQKV